LGMVEPIFNKIEQKVIEKQKKRLGAQ